MNDEKTQAWNRLHEAVLAGEAAGEPASISPVVALTHIHAALDGEMWGPDTLDRIAEIVRAAGYVIEQ